MEPDEFGRIIELQDAIEESDIFTRYSEYIDRVIEFTERNVIPLSEQPEVLREYVGYTRAYRCGSIDVAELERYRLELMKKPYAQKQEEAIAAHMDYLLWFEFLDGTTPERQQDSHTSYLLDGLYKIQHSMALCEELYAHVMGTASVS